MLDRFCIMENGEEVQVTGTRTGEPAAQYTGCHSHGKDQYVHCLERFDILMALLAKPLGIAWALRVRKCRSLQKGLLRPKVTTMTKMVMRSIVKRKTAIFMQVSSMLTCLAGY